jgi:hypothetical protein
MASGFLILPPELRLDVYRLLIDQQLSEGSVYNIRAIYMSCSLIHHEMKDMIRKSHQLLQLSTHWSNGEQHMRTTHAHSPPVPPLRILVSLEQASTKIFTRVAIAIPASELDHIPGSAVLHWPVFHLPTTTLDLRLDSDHPNPIRAAHGFTHLFSKSRVPRQLKFGPRISFAYIERLVLHLGYLPGMSKLARDRLLVSTAKVVCRCLRALMSSGVTIHFVWAINSEDWSLQFGMKIDLEEPENAVLRWRSENLVW